VRSWDGYVALDCGSIDGVEPMGLETDTARGGGDVRGDRIGPVVRGESGDQRVYWRSQTRDDWDGLRVKLRACAADATRVSQLRVVTPDRTWVAQLTAAPDVFISLPVGDRGETLDVHLSAQREAGSLPPTRVTTVPRRSRASAGESWQAEESASSRLPEPAHSAELSPP
jgi:hypothetical protein